MDAAIPLQSAHLNSTLVEDASERKTNESNTCRTNKVPHIDAESHFMRENIGFRVIPTLQT